MAPRLILAGLLLLAAASAQAFDHSHAAWDALVKRHVVVLDAGKASRVRYAGFAQDRAALGAYLAELSRIPASDFSRWSRAEQMAFLINAYNAFTVEKVLQRYPNLRSIRDFGRFFGNPFHDRFFTLFEKPHSLDDIEHVLLRPVYRDPRVHYAVNCASIGCPMLREEAFVAARLEAQLEEQERRFLGDRSRNRLAGGRLEVSRIFEWFREDFEPREAYFARRAHLLADEPAGRQAISEGRAAIAFLEYDWTLNDAR